VVEKLVEAVRKPANHRYSVSRASTSYGSRSAHWYKRRFAVDLDPDAEAIVTMGSKEGIGHLALPMLAPATSSSARAPPIPSISIRSSSRAGICAPSRCCRAPTSWRASRTRAYTWPKPKAPHHQNFPHNPTD